MFFRLAFRNIFRHFGRTFLTFLAIAVGLMFVILMDSMLTGMDKESFEKIINYETGHVKIFSKGYQEEEENFPLDISIVSPETIVDGLKQDPDVAGITERINFRVMLSDGVDQLPAVGIALNPEKDPQVFELESAIDDGQFLSGTEEAMLLGEGLAEDFGVGVGDYLTILTRTKYDTYQALDMRVKGLLKTEDPKIDWSAVVIPISVGKDSLDMGDSVTEIDIKLKDPQKINQFRDKLAAEITGVEVATWRDLAEDVVAISETKRGVSIMIFSGVFLIALIGISNTILLAAFERTREIGMMASLGMKRRQIIWLFVLEGAMIGLFGSIFGCLAGIAANYPIVEYGIPLGSLLKDAGDIGYRITSNMYGIWRPHMIIGTFIFGIVISALVSIYPAWIASRMKPTEALKKV